MSRCSMVWIATSCGVNISMSRPLLWRPVSIVDAGYHGSPHSIAPWARTRKPAMATPNQGLPGPTETAQRLNLTARAIRATPTGAWEGTPSTILSGMSQTNPLRRRAMSLKIKSSAHHMEEAHRDTRPMPLFLRSRLAPRIPSHHTTPRRPRNHKSSSIRCPQIWPAIWHT